MAMDCHHWYTEKWLIFQKSMLQTRTIHNKKVICIFCYHLIINLKSDTFRIVQFCWILHQNVQKIIYFQFPQTGNSYTDQIIGEISCVILWITTKTSCWLTSITVGIWIFYILFVKLWFIYLGGLKYNISNI